MHFEVREQDSVIEDHNVRRLLSSPRITIFTRSMLCW